MKRPPKTIKTRVNLDLDPATLEILNKLEKRFGAESKIETVRRALRMCEGFLDNEHGFRAGNSQIYILV